jgi:hypothetical protein
MYHKHCLAVSLLFLLSGMLPARSDDALALRLVPFPRQVRLEQGSFDLNRPLTLQVAKDSTAPLARLIVEEMERAGLPKPKVAAITSKRPALCLSPEMNTFSLRMLLDRKPAEEAYDLRVTAEAIVCEAECEPGLLHAVQTLRQLIRANRRGSSMPCLTIHDRPSLRWRCFQDDMTRGPSPRMETLRLCADLGSFFKMNLFTYYMESQFAFRKHPVIGPKDGSLTPEELAALVKYARPLGVDILGNQQSFGHFGNILKHEQYAALRETPDVVCPLREETYRLLDDFYSEVCPVVPFPFFNVCCDETYGLGTGPAREMAEKIGVGGVYVQHMRRVHDLLRDKYQKRMMMWGDIILQHPRHLDQIPRDTIMLTWAYDPRANFESQIIPFARSGYEFFVCPGVSDWSRILPDFSVAVTNIRHFVRDGVKHGALGMLNTEWKDDGESLASPYWHGHAWGAECAWTGATTTPEQFNRRIGAVLFGEKGDHFGQAITLLAQTHRLPGMRDMHNRRFWVNDFIPQQSLPTVRPSAERLLALVKPAIEHLEACQQEATVNAELLEGLLHGARRMERIGLRMIDGLDATQAYQQACGLPPREAVPLLDRIELLVRRNRDSLDNLGREFNRLWLREAKPYALDRTMLRYTNVVKWYDDLSIRLARARKQAETGKPLPPAEEVGLALPEAFTRRTLPHQVLDTPLASDVPWAEPSASHRLGLVVRAGRVERGDLPVELDLALPEGLAGKPIRAFRTDAPGGPQEILAQLDSSERPLRTRLTLLVPGPIAKNGQATIHVYLGLATPPRPLPQAVSTRDAPKGMKWIENDKVRLLLGPEGAHVYRWEVKLLNNRDLTMPGETDWLGFADLGGELRRTGNQLVCLARGPALVRYRATDPSGLVKDISLFGGVSWMEVVLTSGVTYYWDFDDPRNFSADGPTPGQYLFSTGKTGAVGKHSEGVKAQVEAPGAYWGLKFQNGGKEPGTAQQRLALGLCTPEVAGRFKIAPGSGAGGVGIEASPDAHHFVTYAGILTSEPGRTMAQLRETLNFTSQPVVILHAMQVRVRR